MYVAVDALGAVAPQRLVSKWQLFGGCALEVCRGKTRPSVCRHRFTAVNTGNSQAALQHFGHSPSCAAADVDNMVTRIRLKQCIRRLASSYCMREALGLLEKGNQSLGFAGGINSTKLTDGHACGALVRRFRGWCRHGVAPFWSDPADHLSAGAASLSAVPTAPHLR